MSRHTDAFTALAIAALLAGCAVGPDYRHPDTPVAADFGAADAAYTAQDPVARFWTVFDDPLLDRLVDDALHANHDLRIALGRLAEARAERHQALYDLAPTVTAQAAHETERLPPVQAGFPFRTSYYEAGFDASWELDLFGRVRRELEASHASLQGAQASLQDAQVSVSAEVARTYFELRGIQRQLAVARANVDNQKGTLDYTMARLEAGRSTELDTSRARAQLSSTLATIDPLLAAQARAIHRLSVLTGREPNALEDVLSPTAELPPLPRITAIGDPASLLRRRPDIRIAERQLAASTAAVGVATADLFPRVTFNGSFGYDASTLSGLGASAGRSYVIGPSISWAFLNLGRVHAQVAAAQARNDTALAQYEKTVLGALEDTENSLVTHTRTRDQLLHATDAADAAAEAAKLARVRYEGGLVDFLEVLDAERTQLQADNQLAQARTDAATSLVAVYKALGGGWVGDPLPRYTSAASR